MPAGLARLHVPEPQRAVVAGGGDGPSVGGKAQGLASERWPARRMGWPPDRGKRLAVRRSPGLHEAAVGADVQHADPAGVAAEDRAAAPGNSQRRTVRSSLPLTRALPSA